MITKLTILSLFFVNILSSQTINIVFNKRLIVNVYSTKQKDGMYYTFAYNALASDVITPHGKFRIVLLDYNKNGRFNDYWNVNSEKRSDGISFIDYKSDTIDFSYWQKRSLKNNYPIAINGFTYRLVNIKRMTKDKYMGALVKESIEYSEIIKNKNGSIVDKLPKKLLEDEKLTIDLKRESYLYIIFYDGKMNYPSFAPNYQTLKNLRKYHLRVLHLGVLKKNKTISDGGQNFNKTDLSFISINDSEKLVKLGCNDTYPNGILFNYEGEVVRFNINIEEVINFFISKKKKK
jgi:hypothetical protein